MTSDSPIIRLTPNGTSVTVTARRMYRWGFGDPMRIQFLAKKDGSWVRAADLRLVHEELAKELTQLVQKEMGR
jgi:hypothetical protein